MSTNKIKKIRLEDIRPSEENKDVYNPPSEDRIIKLANDIKRNGLLEPLIITTDNIILSGHTRYKALKHLERTFVEVRQAGLSSNDPDFVNLLVSCNSQRSKTCNEKMNEVALNVDPMEYIRSVRQKRNEDPDGLKKVDGQLKSNRKLSANYEHLTAAIKKIVNASYRITLRGVFYKLLNEPPIESKYTGNKFSNSEGSYKLLSKVATKMRVNGIINYDSIVDEKRKFNHFYKNGNMESFVGAELDGFLQNYDRDLLQSQERFVCIVCEKETLTYQINSANRDYDLPVLYTQGNSSITVRHKLISESGNKPITLLMLTDLDPSGLKIQDSFVGSLKKDFDIENLRAYRVALKKQHVDEYDLFSDQKAKIKDTSLQKFYDATGMKKVYELDALEPNDMIDLIEEAIRSVLDMDKFNEQVRIYQDEVSKLVQRRHTAIESMVI